MGRRITLTIKFRNRKSALMLIAAVILTSLITVYSLQVRQKIAVSAHQQRESKTGQMETSVNTGGERQYYLTPSIMQDGNEVENACAEGYHMASFWELTDTTQLRYNTALGRTQLDSGEGPVSFFEGWVRTGYHNATDSTPGQGNCDNWSSDDPAGYGTSAYLLSDWSANPDISVWEVNTWSCATNLPVWCMADQVDAGSQLSMRNYYLTSANSYTGNQASTACAGGYHMGALWEILDPSSLRYNHNLGDSRLDAGSGPPAVSNGWVRTGYLSNNTDYEGEANCSAWSTNNGYGTVATLPSEWLDPDLQDVGVWDVSSRQCSFTANVWCVADLIGSGTCSDAYVLPVGKLVHGDTLGYANNIGGYSCSAWNESGPETLYRFVLQSGAFYTVTAELSNLENDLDVFFISADACGSPAACLVSDSYGDTTAVVRNLPGGIYYLAVDGFNAAAGSYDIQVSTSSVPARKVFIPALLRMQ
jgi:hypothetical protein